MHEIHACRKIQTYSCTYLHLQAADTMQNHSRYKQIGTPPEYLQHTYNIPTIHAYFHAKAIGTKV